MKSCRTGLAIVAFAIAATPAANARPESLRVSTPETPEHSPDVECTIDFPRDTAISLHTQRDPWNAFESLSFEIDWPAGAPTNAQVLVAIKDWDQLWYQNLLPGYLAPGRTNLFRLGLSPASSGWEPNGHFGTWHLRALVDPEQFGVRLICPAEYRGSCRVGAVQGSRRQDQGAPTIGNVRALSDRVPCYGLFELKFDLPDRYPNPFDTDQVSVTAIFTAPDGSEIPVAGFYTRDHFRRVTAVGEEVVPQGAPYWCTRFAPLSQGRYSYRLEVRDRWGRTAWGPGSFESGPAETPGFVRVASADRRFFEFSDGSGFFPIGHNVRSATDNRADRAFPWMQRHPEGPASYERYFKAMQAHGENLAEVWTASWSLGLEWLADWPGYHGIGQYNLANAWELDHVVQAADRHGIYLNLVVHNHGKFSTYSDQEWRFNPFNTRNGGYLRRPEEYFSDPRALDAFRDLMRYMIARWGYSTRVFAWELWSELNLAGSERVKHRIHQLPEVVEWHRVMGRAIKEMDPNDHMIGSHVAADYKAQNFKLVGLPEIDFCPVNGYYADSDPVRIVQVMSETAIHNNRLDKPVLITEFGGSHMGESVKHLEESLHAGLWASTCTPIGGTPLFWWWQLIEEDDFYPLFASVARFMDGEDRRDPRFETCRPEFSAANGSAGGLDARCLRSPARALGWIYRKADFGQVDPNGEPVTTGITMAVRGLDDGPYRVEFWDTVSGAPGPRETIDSTDGELQVAVPPFARDIAFKIRRR